MWFALRHPLAPPWLKPAVALVALYLISPIDLLPEAIPFVGLVDDIVARKDLRGKLGKLLAYMLPLPHDLS